MRLLTRDLACRQAVELVTDYLEGRLSWHNRRRFEAHIAACPSCRAYLDQMRYTIAAAERIEPADLAPEVREDLIDLFRRYQEQR